MPGRDILVQIPAYPYTLDTFTPNLRLALHAAQLRHAGSEVLVRDFSTLETAERFFTREVRAVLHDTRRQSSQISDRLRGIIPKARARRALHQHGLTIAKQIGEEISLAGVGADTRIWFWVESIGELPLCRTAAEVISASHPSVQIREIGSLFERRPRLRRTHPDSNDPMSEAPECPVLPAYDVDVYPSLSERGKVSVFTLPEVDSEDGEPVWSARILGEQIASLQQRYGAQGFHLLGSGVIGQHAEALARELLTRRAVLRYGREGRPAPLSTNALTSLRLSGCSGISYTIHSGSQRLLDDYYQHPLSVSQTESVLRSTKFAGLYTTARFTFPCVEDDFHTRAETMRLIERSRPDAVTLDWHAETAVSHRSQREQASLRDEVEAIGVSTRVTSRMALMADLAGYAGEEREFCDAVERQVHAGDLIGLASTVARVNRSQRAIAADAIGAPFAPDKSAVGN